MLLVILIEDCYHSHIRFAWLPDFPPFYRLLSLPLATRFLNKKKPGRVNTHPHARVYLQICTFNKKHMFRLYIVFVFCWTLDTASFLANYKCDWCRNCGYHCTWRKITWALDQSLTPRNEAETWTGFNRYRSICL